MRLLLTGATGFIGSRLARRLRDRGDTVVHLGRRPCGLDGVQEVTVPDPLEACLTGRAHIGPVDAVLHLAAGGVHPADRDMQRLRQINVALPPALVRFAAARGAGAVVCAGSSAEYATLDTPRPFVEDDALERQAPYGASKAEGGEQALRVGRELAVPVGWLRLFNAYGPGERPHRLLPCLLSELQAGRRVALSPGRQIRDFVHVDDICDALTTSLDALLTGQMESGTYNVASGSGQPVFAFAEFAADAIGAPRERLDFGAVPMRAHEQMFVVGNPERLQKACGWRPRFDLADGVRAAVEEMRAR